MNKQTPAEPKLSEVLAKMPRKQASNKETAIFLLVVVLVIVGIVSWVGSGPKAKYQASVDSSSMLVVNPATLSVGGTIKNTGKKAGAPYCTLNVQDPSGTYSGADAFELSSTLQPGQSKHWQDPSVTITKQGASYVTQGTITCN